MRVLVKCPACNRQSDAGELPVGSKFHCLCGHVLQVPAMLAKDAAVVRCSSCGGPRTGGEAACRFCRADFTIHERDLDTLCPACMTRIMRSARFCHNCATRIVVDGKSGAPTELPCPACGGDRRLDSRTFGQPPVAVCECHVCGGLWIGGETFGMLTERARGQAAATPSRSGQAAETTRRGQPGQHGPLYRHCPTCRQMMVRRNYARWSGVILDTCNAHGIWLDEGELQALLQWIRRGGPRQAEELERRESLRAEQRLHRGAPPSRIDRLAGRGVARGMVVTEGEGGSPLLEFFEALFGCR